MSGGLQVDLRGSSGPIGGSGESRIWDGIVRWTLLSGQKYF